MESILCGASHGEVPKSEHRWLKPAASCFVALTCFQFDKSNWKQRSTAPQALFILAPCSMERVSEESEEALYEALEFYVSGQKFSQAKTLTPTTVYSNCQRARYKLGLGSRPTVIIQRDENLFLCSASIHPQAKACGTLSELLHREKMAEVPRRLTRVPRTSDIRRRPDWDIPEAF